MSDLQPGPDLVGQKVCNPLRPEWGVGTVLRVQAAGSDAFRISVQFPTGHRTIMVPPGRLAAPQAEQGRAAGWLEAAAGRTMDDRLTALPEDLLMLLGTQAQRLAAAAPLYAWSDEPAALVQWARRQSGVADPLAHWSRDELVRAFEAFCARRDAWVRETAATLRKTGGAEAVREALERIEAPQLRARLRAAL